jgi:cytochrome d ubiquinol oxidase subunit I
MSYHFGTNWSRFSDFAGTRRRPGDRLRGDHRLFPRGGVPRHHAVRLGSGSGDKLHFFATCMVALGT